VTYTYYKFVNICCRYFAAFQFNKATGIKELGVLFIPLDLHHTKIKSIWF